MLGYYPNSNAKPRGSNLKAKVQTLVLWTFRKHLCGLTYIDSTIHTNVHNTQYTTITPTNTLTQTHLLTNDHIYISAHTYPFTNTPTYK